MRIRPATPQDVPLLLTLVRELASYERLEHRVVATEADFAASLFGERRLVEALIAETADGEALGYAIFFHNFSTFVGTLGLWMEDIYVRPAHRGQGHGRALLRALATIAQARGCGRMEWSALNWNRPAIDFYLACGAASLDDWTMFRLESNGIARLTGPGEG